MLPMTSCLTFHAPSAACLVLLSSNTLHCIVSCTCYCADGGAEGRRKDDAEDSQLADNCPTTDSLALSASLPWAT